MPSELQVLPLEECLEALIDYRGKTPRKTDSGIPLITAKVVKGGRIETPTEFIAPEDFDSWMTRGLPRIGDVVMTTEAPLGEVGQILSLPVALAQRIVTLRGKPHLLDNDYLLYMLQAEAFQEQLKGRSSGTTVVGIKQSELRKVRLHLPPVQLQREVASILKALDRRIDLLRQTNSTLDSIAQVLFKSWFINFDPVLAKADGREPDGMDAATAALFPAQFEDSELGPVPKGWTAQPIGDLVEAVGGSTPDTKNDALWEPAAHHWTSPKDLSGATAPVLLDTERKVSDAGLAKISSGLLPVGTLLMSSRAPIGYLSLSQIPVAINQGYIAMPPGGRLPPAYLYFWCQLNMDAIKGRANGSTFMEISKKAFRPIPALSPSPEVVDRFHDFATAVFNRLTANERQARALAELRDTLLPRLISGKLQLQELQVQGDEVLA
ncbi:restriction endonuclease S subunits [Serpentinimonas maccroryi]|uniref:Restriction endonuclease S subunits n=1 Tax=Serpentinimonas maccroryi TaxID=1458426 RepID=A0A060NMW9_9BURK|nr:restriction endonuclease subunit S [Serpentinimonas maccroryi]BAO83142.1 restriction endonuclease S subunits [Serpentinimonas maccroryi]